MYNNSLEAYNSRPENFTLSATTYTNPSLLDPTKYYNIGTLSPTAPSVSNNYLYGSTGPCLQYPKVAYSLYTPTVLDNASCSPINLDYYNIWKGICTYNATTSVYSQTGSKKSLYLIDSLKGNNGATVIPAKNGGIPCSESNTYTPLTLVSVNPTGVYCNNTYAKCSSNINDYYNGLVCSLPTPVVTSTNPLNWTAADRTAVIAYIYANLNYGIIGNNLYPPAPLTSPSTVLSGLKYGNGVYTASASSSSILPWYAFDNNMGLDLSTWSSSNALTNSAGYSGNYVTYDKMYNSYPGEWIQLQLPVAIVISNYNIIPRATALNRAPTKFWILGSTNGTIWNLVDTQTSGVYTTAGLSFTPTFSTPYVYFRLVVYAIGNSVSDYVNISEWQIYGGNLNSVSNSALYNMFLNNYYNNPVLKTASQINTTTSTITPSLPPSAVGLQCSDQIVNNVTPSGLTLTPSIVVGCSPAIGTLVCNDVVSTNQNIYYKFSPQIQGSSIMGVCSSNSPFCNNTLFAPVGVNGTATFNFINSSGLMYVVDQLGQFVIWSNVPSIVGTRVSSATRSTPIPSPVPAGMFAPPAGGFILPMKLVMQSDSNLVVYDSINKPVWGKGNTNRGAGAPFTFKINIDGSLNIVDYLSNPVWSTTPAVLNGSYVIKGGNKRMNCSDNGNAITVCGKTSVSTLEIFTITNISGNTYSIKGGNQNMYCSAGAGLICNKPTVGALETFTITNIGGNKYNIKGSQGMFCSDNSSNGGGIICNVSVAAVWEVFTIVKI
jgi:hypothetical protein